MHFWFGSTRPAHLPGASSSQYANVRVGGPLSVQSETLRLVFRQGVAHLPVSFVHGRLALGSHHQNDILTFAGLVYAGIGHGILGLKSGP